MKRFSLLLLLCLQHFVNAQQLYFYKPEALKSIPSSESYNIIQDSKGYIWFSTEAGLCRYNGSAIQLFDEKKGLKEKACYSVKEDGKGNLWLVTSANRVLCLKSDSIWEAPFSKQYASSFKKSLEQTYLFQFENDNCFWLNTQTHTYLAFTNRTAYQKVAPEPSDADYYFLKSGNNYVPIKNKILDPNFNYHTKTPNQLKIILKNNGKETTLYIPHKLSSTPSWRVLSTTANNGSSYIAFENVLLTIDEGMHYSVEEFPNSILSIYSDKNNGLWIAMRKGGLRYYPDPNNRQYSINSLSEYSVSGVCVDNEQGVWCTTLEKGVFYCRNKYIVGYGSTAGLNQTADLLKSVNNRVFASTTANTLIELSNGKIIEYPLNFKAPFFVSDIIQHQNNWFLGGKEFTARSTANFGQSQVLKLNNYNITSGSNQFAVDKKNNIIYSVHFGDILTVNEKMLNICLSPLESPGRCIFFSETKGLYLGCKDGLFQVDTTNFTTKPVGAITGNVTKIIERSNHEIWVATKENGIFVLRNNNVFNLEEVLRLPTKRIYDLTEDLEGNIWIGSNSGLIKYTDKKGPPAFQIYNTLNGLPSDELFHVTTDSTTLYMATSEGVCSFLLKNQLQNSSAPAIFLRSLRVNERLLPSVKGKLFFHYNENSLTLDFDVLSYKSGSQPSLVYSLQSIQTEIQYNKASELRLNNLAPGAYKLTVFGSNNDNLYSTAPYQLNFEIQAPIWKTPGFIAFGLIAIVMFIYLVIKNIINQIRKKEEEKTRINKLLAEHQLSALKAQMNPHFIFNCINSIQRYILTNKSEEAYGYLTQFSKLIRLVLNYSDKNRITLAQELEIIELYLKLEKLRFENKFEYIITCDPSIVLDETLVPAMIMQPYIENAIWHGIMNLKKERQGQIHIQILPDLGLLKIVIEDNGVGRAKAAMLSAKNHESKGTDINQKRATIINMIENTTSLGGIVIEDIVDSTGEVAGTRVIIHIPQTTLDHEN